MGIHVIAKIENNYVKENGKQDNSRDDFGIATNTSYGVGSFF